MPQRLHRCTVFQLRKIAKLQGISKYEKLKRHELLKILQQQDNNIDINNVPTSYSINTRRRHLLLKQCRQMKENSNKLNATLKIQRWYRYWKSIRSIEDPITLDNIEGRPFIHISKLAPYASFTFGAQSLAKFVIDSLNFYNPMTREQFNEIEVKRLNKLSGNYNTLFSFYNRHTLIEEREKCEIAIKSFQWDIEESIEFALDDAIQISDRHGIADTNDVYDLIHEFQSTVVPDVLISLHKIQEYEKLPRMDGKTSTTLADNMITLIDRHIPNGRRSEKSVDVRILNYLKSIFHKFIELSQKSTTLSHTHNQQSNINVNNTFQFTNYYLNDIPNTPMFIMQSNTIDVTNPLNNALMVFFDNYNR